MDKKQIKYANMRAAKKRKRLDSAPRERIPVLPELRKKIVITDYDFGEVSHTLELKNSGRIDCYNVYVDGVLWKKRIGFSNILVGIRKSIPRVKSARNME